MSHRSSLPATDAVARMRADRRRLPALLRPVHRALSGIADAGEAPRRSDPLRELRRDLALLAGTASLAGTLAALAAGGGTALLLALPAAYASLAATGRLRRLVVGDVHEAGHGTARRLAEAAGASPREARAMQRLILDVGSAVTLTLDGRAYARAHARHHDAALGTIRDPDGADLKRWGFWRGLPAAAFFPRLAATLASPRWHLAFLTERLRSNLVEAGPGRRAGAAAMLAGLGALGLVLPLPAFLAAVVFPWTVGYHGAALLQVLTEHFYGFEADTRSDGDAALRTFERIPCEPLPPAGLTGTRRLRAYAGWLARLAVVHLPTRLAVLDTTMIAHSFHHTAYPAGLAFDDWWNTAVHMTAARDAGLLPAHAERVPAFFGLPAALRAQRSHLARLAG